MFRKTILNMMTAIMTVSMVTQNSFAITNELIKPKTDSTIIDIGYQNPQGSYNVTVPKDWQFSDALIRDIDNSVYSMQRELTEKWDCEIDYLGRENCTEDAVDCLANLQQDDGISEKVDKIQRVNKIKISVPRNQADNPNQLKGDISVSPNIGAVDGARFDIQYDERRGASNLPSVDQMMADGFVKDGKFAMKIFNFGSNSGGMSIVGGSPTATVIINGGASMPTTYHGGKGMATGNGRYGLLELVWNTKPSSVRAMCDDYCLIGKPNDPQFGFWAWGCPDTFVAADNIKSEEGICEKNYSYYEYKCKTDTNTYDRPWVGPVLDSGGDCNGNCGPSGCICNSPTPPSNNCVRDDFTCPFDDQQLCTITTDDKASSDNAIDGYIYSNGSANTYSKTVTTDKVCTGGYEWNAEKDLCEIDLSYSCLNSKYIYDEELDECIKPLECDGTLTDDGKCIVEAEHNCPTGYRYDSGSQRCETLPICDRGEYNTYTDQCEEKANEDFCDAPFVFNETNQRCERPLSQVNKECPERTLILNEEESICEGWADISTWTQRGNPSAGNWTFNVNTRTLYQSINGQPTFYVSTAVYPAAILEGKFKVSNDGDDDWAGIVFGWTGDGFLAFDWKKRNQGPARGGIRLMKFNQSTTSGTFDGWGTPTSTAYKEVLDSNYSYGGWSYNTWYNLKIVVVDGKIEAYINDSKALEYQDPTFTDLSGQLGFLNVSQSKVSYKDFYITTMPTCPAGYEYNIAKAACTELLDNELNLDGNVVWKYPNCIVGDWNSDSQICSFNASCTEGGLLDMQDDTCAIVSSDSCPAAVEYECPTNFYYSQSLNKCVATPTCPSGSNFNYISSKCETNPICEENQFGYSDSRKRCEATLSAEDYSCLNTEITVNTATYDYCKVEKEFALLDKNTDGSCPTGSFEIDDDGVAKCKYYQNCPLNYVEDSNAAFCKRDITCPSGYTIDYSKNLCIQDESFGTDFAIDTLNEVYYYDASCPTGFTYNSLDKVCQADTYCAVGTLNAGGDKCIADFTSEGQIDYVLNSDGTCTMDDVFCPLPSVKESYYIDDTTGEKKVCGDAPECPVGMSFNSSRGACEMLPICDAGTYDLASNKCVGSITCEVGYTLDNATNTCFKQDSGNSYDLTTGMSLAEGTCPANASGSNLINGTCIYEPSCANGAILNETTDRCEIVTNDMQECSANSICVTIKEPTCEQGYIYNSVTNKCESEPYCPSGYLTTNEGCVRNYTYSEYTCPEDYEGPLETGFDCEATCGANGCACNAPTPPANNCKKPYSLSGDEITITKERDLEEHAVTGAVTPAEYGAIKGFDCGDECLFNVKKITGNDNKLCFSKDNGENSCITVSGCSFSGEITNPVAPNELFDLNVDNQYTLSLGEFNPSPTVTDDNLDCPSGMVYNPTLKMCATDEVSDFNDGWTEAGNPADGDWRIASSGTSLTQVINGLTTLFLHPKEFDGELIMEGEIRGNQAHYNSIGLAFGFKSNSDFYVIDWGNSWGWNSYRILENHSDLNLIKVNSTSENYSTYFRANSDLLATHSGTKWVAGNWYKIKAIISGGNIKVFIDGDLKIDYTLPNDETFQSGRAGFYNLSTPNVSYRNFFMRTAPTCPDDYEWNSTFRECAKPTEPFQDSKITSTCKLNGHVGWHSRNEGIISIIPDPDNKSKILFWDSYLDKDIGFLEFVKDVSDENRVEGYIPENKFLYEMLSKGFTAIDSVDNNTLFTSSYSMSSEACTNLSAEIGLPKATMISGTTRAKAKILSGDRYVKTYQDPACPFGFFVPSIMSCVADINTATCTEGKYDKIDLPSEDSETLKKYAIWDNAQGDNVELFTPFYAPYSGFYYINIATVGDAQLQIDNVMAAYVQFWDTKEFTQKFYMDEGLHEIKVIAKKDTVPVAGAVDNTVHYGQRGVGVVIYDEAYQPLTTSDKWCKNSQDGECPDAGYEEIGNLCVETSIPHCYNGYYDEDIQQCVLEPKCILSKAGEESFSAQTKSIKTEVRDASQMVFKCSPLKCVGNQCQKANCPTDTNGDEYLGNVFAPGSDVQDTDCVEQSCDANLDYYEYCGKEGSCDLSNPLAYEDANGDCHELYCDDGYIMDVDARACKRMECPDGSTEQANGSCVRD